MVARRAFRRKAGKRKGRRMNRRRSAGGLGRGDVARVTANLGQVLIGANTPYSMMNFGLSNSQRACAVASAYQYYRIKRITIKVKPLYDTFQLGASSTVTLPYLYYMIDRHNTFPANTTVATLKNAGCKPLRLDDKTRTISFKPSVMNVSITQAGSGSAPTLTGSGTYRVSPWLSTNLNNNGGGNPNVPPGAPGAVWKPDSTDHQGLILFIEQYSVPTPNQVANLEYIVEYEFKKRLWEPPATSTDVTVNQIDIDNLVVIEPENPPPLSQA